MGESNAESVERTDAIEAEYQLRKNLKKADRGEEKRVNKNKHSLYTKMNHTTLQPS